ncbi:MAG TPA: KpsF/GutQ family sugar-phosphate isomerase [Hellea balneolensis]|uniref:KpsF/GutQ family sugar-phosphate isomerase n=1 Tax=Hellea balneolensis TaxID=287478 RepID=A0A7C3C943_9PROT|nr:KpsF/GutQ family sugar-phosphate isomerase [Hellea balneolensis]
MSQDIDIIEIARRVLKTEQEGLKALSASLGTEFKDTVSFITSVKGHVILAGVGKSGHVARKIAATLASTGTPSLFVHPTEASHGDMGMITKGDAVIALSRSGETHEFADMLAFCRRFSVPIIAITGHANSTLAKAAQHVLLLPDAPEACAVTGAPTTSTTLQISLGDALAVALLEARGFTAHDFKAFHPGGRLGAQMASASDLMHEGDHMPLVKTGTNMVIALETMSAKGFGCVGVVDPKGNLAGMITDGDIRRNLDKDLTKLDVDVIMTKAPKTIESDMLAIDALRYMTKEPPNVMQVFVVDGQKAIGILHMHDLIRAGLA